ncbi:MAG: T9SS type A sorting domain-containing protein [Crocinitomicaceae bacterium]
MNKLILLFLLITSSYLNFAQTNDVALDSMLNRFNVGEYYSNGIEYFRLPQDQLRPLNCSALISNIGTNDITNCHLRVDVKYGGSTIFTEYSDSIFIPAGGQDSLYLNTSIDFSSQPQGMYTIVYTMDSDSSDINLADNADSLYFEITQNQLSRSDFNFVDSTSNYFQDTLDSFGYVFKLESDACLGYIMPWVTYNPVNPSVGIGGVHASIFVLDTISGEYNPIGTTTEMPITNSDLGGPIMIPVDYWMNDLIGGNTYLIAVNTQFHDFYLCQNSIDTTVYRAMHTGAPGGGYIENEPMTNVRMIKMDFSFNDNSQCSVGFHQAEKVEIEFFPNPNQGIIQVKLSDQTVENIGVEIYNMNGQLVFEQKIINQSSFPLEINHLPNGVYSFHVINQNMRITEKLIVQK